MESPPQPTAALVLAAGLGTRFGGRKLLAPIHGKPMLQHVLDLAFAVEMTPVVVVLGADADELEAACSWRGELRLRNAAPAGGLAGSVKLGVRALLRSHADRVAMLMGDQTFLYADLLRVVLRTLC